MILPLTSFQCLIDVLIHNRYVFFSQIQRLPFLLSSNLALDTLRGSDESIGFEDILNGQDVGVLHCCWHEGPDDDFFLTLRPLSVFLQIQPRAK